MCLDVVSPRMIRQINIISRGMNLTTFDNDN